MDVVGFGALNVDLSYEVSESLAERLSVRAGKEREGRSLGSLRELEGLLEKEKLLGRSGGGSAANVMVALSRMGFDTGYLGKVGDDKEGDFLISTLEDVNVSRILQGEGKSGICLALQTKDQKDRFLAIFPGSNNTIDANQIDINYINQAKILHLTSFVGDQSFEAQIETLKRIDPSVFVSFDGGMLYAKRGRRALEPFLRRSNIIFPSWEEVVTLTEGKDYRYGILDLLFNKDQIGVVTLGSGGCYVATRNGVSFEMPPERVLESSEIVDNIGAGDAFAAGFLAGLLEKKSLEECARFANRAAAKSLTGAGRTNYPTKEDLRFL